MITKILEGQSWDLTFFRSELSEKKKKKNHCAQKDRVSYRDQAGLLKAGRRGLKSGNAHPPRGAR